MARRSRSSPRVRGALDTPSSAAPTSNDLERFLGGPPVVTDPPTWADHFSGAVLSEVEDRRRFYPGPFPTDWEPAKLITGRPARVVAPPPRKTQQRGARRLPWANFTEGLSSSLQFQHSRQTVVCVKRRVRKEVLHAKGVAGGRVGRPKYTIYSSIHCRRR